MTLRRSAKSGLLRALVNTKEKWIAFRKGMNLQNLENSPRLGDLLESHSHEIQSGKGPLFAFVTFERVFV
jgi:hypothetical protein